MVSKSTAIPEVGDDIDPENPPLSDAKLARMKHVPLAKMVRRKVGMSQEDFAANYHIPLGTLRDWEQGRREPDQSAMAFLKVIFHASDVVRSVLARKTGDQPRKSMKTVIVRDQGGRILLKAERLDSAIKGRRRRTPA